MWDWTPQQQRLADLMLALSVLSWGVLGLVHAHPADRWTVVRLAIAAIHFSVAILLLMRQPARRQAPVPAIAAALPGLVIGGVALASAPAPSQWPWYAQTVFAFAAAFAVVSLFSLGRSFAILPSVRESVDRGPYQLVRHPIYAGELLLVLSCVLAGGSLTGIVTLALALPFIALRLLTEEQLLSEDAAYQTYMARVKWRLIPGLW